MKQLRRVHPSAIYSIPFLLFVFILVLITSYLLADRGISGLFSANLFTSPRGILLLVIVPVSLLLFLGFFFYGIVSHTLQSGRVSRFGRKLFVLFTTLIVIVAIFTTLIAGRFAGSAVASWFDGSLPEALRSAKEISDLYKGERERAIERVAIRFLNGLAIVNQQAMRREWMEEMRVLDPYASSCQVYQVDSSGEYPKYHAIIETGDMDYFIPQGQLDIVRDGFFPYNFQDTAYRYGKLVRYSSKTYVCVYSSLIPERYFQKDARIREVYQDSRIIEALVPVMPFMGLWIFFMFCLPPVMMAVILGYALLQRISSPVLDAAEFSTELVDESRSFRVVSHSKDEVGSLLDNLNRLAEKPKEGGKRGDKKTSLRL